MTVPAFWLGRFFYSLKGAEVVKDERIVKAEVAKRYTLGVVYSPLEVDSQGDYSDAREIEKACHEFTKHMQNKTTVNKRAAELLHGIVKALADGGSVQVDIDDVYEDIQKGLNGPLGIMHYFDGNDAGVIVENYILPCDSVINGENVAKGSWMMGVIWEPAYFAKIQDGTFTGYSMGGAGKRVASDVLKVASRGDVDNADKKRAEDKYGDDAHFADAKNKKYPLDTAEHVRAAASYFGMAKNRSEYSDADQKTIDSKIDAAKKKFGIDVEKSELGLFAKFAQGINRLIKDITADGGSEHVDKPLGEEKCSKCGKHKKDCGCGK